MNQINVSVVIHSLSMTLKTDVIIIVLFANSRFDIIVIKFYSAFQPYHEIIFYIKNKQHVSL